jgi:hypothetical protein
MIKAWLEGDEIDLQALTDLLTHGDMRVLRDEAAHAYYLTAPSIDNPPQPRHFDISAGFAVVIG